MAAAMATATTKMATRLSIGQTIRGSAGVYTILDKIHDCVWTAKNEIQKKFIIKSDRHWRLQNERDLLKHFQHRTPYLRPVVDEIVEPAEPPTIVLRWLDDDMRRASFAQRLTRGEVKYVARRVLEALSVLHDAGYVHTDVKPHNILVNYGTDGQRFKEVQLADLGSTVHETSKCAKEGLETGTDVFRSPEAHLMMAWGPPMDIWAFGATLISLMFGRGFYVFEPDLPEGHPEYSLNILLKHHRIFGPWPRSFVDLTTDCDQLRALSYIMEISPSETLTLFKNATDDEICTEDKEFVLRIMKLDPRDRPTARALLQDIWFLEDDIEIGAALSYPHDSINMSQAIV